MLASALVPVEIVAKLFPGFFLYPLSDEAPDALAVQGQHSMWRIFLISVTQRLPALGTNEHFDFRLNFLSRRAFCCARLKRRDATPMIIALAGRRVDAADAKQRRFPAENVDIVRERIHAMLQTQCAVALVGSAACGADLLALSEAGKMGLRRSVVLPFGREKFRTTSVTDRPGDWGPLYDKQLNEVEKSGDLLVVHVNSEDKAYAEANHAIVDRALLLGQELQDQLTAVLVWDGKSRGEGDLTEEFGFYARGKSIPVIEVMTL